MNGSTEENTCAIGANFQKFLYNLRIEIRVTDRCLNGLLRELPILLFQHICSETATPAKVARWHQEPSFNQPHREKLFLVFRRFCTRNSYNSLEVFAKMFLRLGTPGRASQPDVDGFPQRWHPTRRVSLLEVRESLIPSNGVAFVDDDQSDISR